MIEITISFPTYYYYYNDWTAAKIIYDFAFKILKNNTRLQELFFTPFRLNQYNYRENLIIFSVGSTTKEFDNFHCEFVIN